MSSNKRSMSDDSKSDNASQARSYPRKRVSIAVRAHIVDVSDIGMTKRIVRSMSSSENPM